MNKKVGVIVIAIVAIMLIAIMLIAILTTSLINKNEPKDNGSSSGEKINENVTQIIEEENSIEKIDNLKEALLKSEVLSSYKEVDNEESNETYGFNFDESIHYFVLKSTENNNEICVVEIPKEKEIDDDKILIKLTKRYDYLLTHSESIEGVSIKKRSNILFLIISNNKDEIENIIEKEYLDK